ncbi:uncharacterized protein [Venturia canescens]|uniref:uncharacterized protein n=1 Tax=Venturia canescens TaxID=32260 RepID=UPI001C9D5567|nr:uncharacterized protein LOC122411124 [Venturia canescens]
MNGSMKMNNFLQRMLKKSEDELDGEKLILGRTSLKVENFPHCETPNRVRNRSTCSLNETNSPPIPRSPSRPITLRTEGYQKNYQRNSMPGLRTPENTSDTEDIPKIEKIRREFEMGFLSPTKRENKEVATRSGRFVKKLVAAFEEKYNKTFNEVKTEAKQISRESESSDDGSFRDEATIVDMMEESMAILSDTYVIESLESRLSRYLNSYIASSSFREEESPSESEGSLDLGKSCLTMDEELHFPKKNMSQKKVMSRPKSDTILMRPMAKDEAMQSSRNLVRRDSSLRRERQPKIVGAYLKEPVEVEDTSIDWIPIRDQKLPRKRSFKKLLSMLTGKKSSVKTSKLYCSEINLQEETTKELLQDSGYDEKSGSSSSLVSLVSIGDLMLQQKFGQPAPLEDDRRAYNMTTFQKPPASNLEHVSINENDDNFPDDDFSSTSDEASDTSSISSKRILLEEVSRSELRLSLGPAFPCAPGAKVVCSLGRKANPKNAKNNWTFLDEIEPIAPPLPKHPFISARKMPVDDCDGGSNGSSDKIGSQIDMSFSDFDNVELRKKLQTWTFPGEDCHYDTPRRYLSKSEPGLLSLDKLRNIGKLPSEIVYDVPKPKIPRRPRSSIYDDALSLKRRNDNFTSHRPPLSSEFYGFPTTQEPHYATIKPRNMRMIQGRQFLRSIGDLNCNNPLYANYYGDSPRNGIIV